MSPILRQRAGETLLVFFLSLAVPPGINSSRMTALRQNPPVQSSVHCDRCGMSCAIIAPGLETTLGGWRLVWRAAVIFLLPLAVAAVGSYAWRATPEQQVLGAFVGFAVGVSMARLITHKLQI